MIPDENDTDTDTDINYVEDTLDLLGVGKFNEIALDRVESEEYQSIWDKIVEYRRLADYLERGLYATIQDSYGINLDVEDWELDRQQGVLRRNS